MKKIELLFLLAIGLSSVSYADGTAPDRVDGTSKVTSIEAKKMFDKGVLFIDSRREKYHTKYHIPNAVNISTRYKLSEEALLKVMKKTDKAVFYCHGINCPASSKGLTRAVNWGFTKLYYYRDGIDGWKASGYAIEK